MTKGDNLVPSVEVKIFINSQTAWHLDRLIETGLYGNSRAEAVKVVLYDHCKLLRNQGELGRVPPFPGSDAVEIVSG